MTAPIRYLDPMLLTEAGPTLLAALEPLRRPDGRFVELLRSRPEALVVVALDVTGAIGWAAAEPDGLVGVFVAPARRRRGIGTRLARSVVSAAYEGKGARWPGLDWRTSTAPGSPGRAFWQAVYPAPRRAA